MLLLTLWLTHAGTSVQLSFTHKQTEVHIYWLESLEKILETFWGEAKTPKTNKQKISCIWIDTQQQAEQANV